MLEADARAGRAAGAGARAPARTGLAAADSGTSSHAVRAPRCSSCRRSHCRRARRSRVCASGWPSSVPEASSSAVVRWAAGQGWAGWAHRWPSCTRAAAPEVNSAARRVAGAPGTSTQRVSARPPMAPPAAPAQARARVVLASARAGTLGRPAPSARPGPWRAATVSTAPAATAACLPKTSTACSAAQRRARGLLSAAHGQADREV